MERFHKLTKRRQRPVSACLSSPFVSWWRAMMARFEGVFLFVCLVIGVAIVFAGLVFG